MKRILWAIPPVLVLIPLLAFGFGRNPSLVADPLVRHPAPDFVLRSTSGRLLRLSSLRGRPVVVNFFASWCTSCREQEGNLVKAYHRWHGRVTFLGVIYEDSVSAAAAFTRSQGGTWPDLIDGGTQTAINYGVTGVPETFFINRRGLIVAHSVSLSTAALDLGISEILKV